MPFWIANWMFIRPTTFSAWASLRVCSRSSSWISARQAVRRQRAAGIAGVHAGLLDVLHDAADQHVLAVADRIDVHLDGDVEEPVEQHRAVVGHLHRVVHVGAQVVLVVDDFHGAAAEHVGRPHHQRKADLARQRDGLLLGARGARSAAACSPSFFTSCWKRSRSSAMSIESGEVPMIGAPAASSARASFSGVWPPNCTITPFGLLLVRRSPARPRASAARSTGGRRCRSRWRRSPDCS